jgi:D-alanyl-D-alanine carboxypeptidase/D-alanyl-D-alanine-endopeptidase (penicillin-binding protein 4)
MKKILFLLIVVFPALHPFAQSISKRLQGAYQKFEKDSQLTNGISSLYVINSRTGEVVFDRNSQIGLPTASTLKIITAATAYELMGKDFKYKTEFGYKGKIENGNLKGLLYVIGSGDPTFGSWRYSSTNADLITKNLVSSVRKAGINNDTLHPTFLLFDISRYSDEMYNDGWIWQDLANYYGISSCALNWRENQFDAVITPGSSEGDEVKDIRLSPRYVERRLSVSREVRTGKKNSGDNAYFYLAPGEYGTEYFLRLTGTIPAGVDSFVVSASHPNPMLYFAESLFATTEIEKHFGSYAYFRGGDTSFVKAYTNKPEVIYTHYSPPLDSIIYWFLKKSINLYGEALVKAFAYQKNGFGETNKGIEIVKNFWKEKGIAPAELNIVDGSGLSPLNRVTTHAQVTVLKYAKNQSWFNGYYDAFPEYNGMKMKSGTITGTKGFCGYQKSKDGNEYIFSFLVNNYNGSSSSIVQKMYRVLDELKN